MCIFLGMLPVWYAKQTMSRKGVISNTLFKEAQKRMKCQICGFDILVYHDHMENASAYHKEIIRFPIQ